MAPMGPDPRGTRLIYDVVEAAFTAEKLFRQQFDRYEQKVLQLASERGLDRRDLRLEAHELATLFDFKSLEELRDRHLFRLKELSHALFRRKDRTDPFDRYVSDAFHEISILKEEHYTVGTYGTQYAQSRETEESRQIIEEVHEYFPRRIRSVRRLIEKALTRLLAVLADYRENGILVRSLYLYGDDLTAGVLPGGLADLYAAMFPEGGALAGYVDAARRFAESGFDELARRAMAHAEGRLAGAPDVAAAPARTELERVRGLLAASKPEKPAATPVG